MILIPPLYQRLYSLQTIAVKFARGGLFLRYATYFLLRKEKSNTGASLPFCTASGSKGAGDTGERVCDCSGCFVLYKKNQAGAIPAGIFYLDHDDGLILVHFTQ